MKKSLLLLIAICFVSLLSGCGSGSTGPTQDVATHFSVTSGNAAPTAGIPFSITVTALDAAGLTVATYSGTVHFASSNGQPVLPATATVNNGSGTFTVTLNTAGSQTITVTDGASLTGSTLTPLVVAPDVATQFSVTPATTTPAAGTAFMFTVTALDAANNPFPSYSGTVQFTSSDQQASFAPVSAPLVNGTGTFSVTLKTAGPQTITATDTVKASITGISTAAKVSSGPATQLSFGSLGNAFITRHPIAVTVYALDAFNNTATSYPGTVSFRSTDRNAILPKPLLLTNGVQSTTLALETAGTQTFTASDTVTASLTKTTAPITVTAAPMLAITSAAPPKGTVNVDYGPTKTVEELCQRTFHGVSCSPCQPANPCGQYPPCASGGNVFPCHELVQVFSGFTFKAIGGVPPYQWSASALPPGLTVNATSGEILGTPTKFGIYANIGAMVTDSGNPAAQTPANVSITIFAPPLFIMGSNPPDGVVGTAYSDTLTTSGGTNPVTWSVSAGTLPPGLTLSASAGTITGSPTMEGFFNFTVQAADSSTPQLTSSAALTITVNPQAANNAELNGQYAFAFRGFMGSGPDGIIGSFTADGKGNLTNGLQDLNQVQGGVISQAFTGTYEIFADNRGIMKLMSSPGGADLGTFRFAVGSITAGVASKGRFVNFDPPVNNSPMQGEGVFEKQDPTAFSTSKITGDYAFGVSADSFDSNTKFGAAGRFTAAAGVISSGVIDEDSFGTVTSNSAFTGTYSVAANGRGTMTLTIAGAANPVNLVFYVVSGGELLVQSSDVETINSLFAGTIFQQSGAGAFSNTSLNSPSVVALTGLTANGPSNVVLGVLNFPSAGNFKLVGDENNAGTLQALNQMGTYSVASNGRVTVTGTTTKPLVFYLVGPNQGFVVGTDSSSSTGFVEPQSGAFTNASANGAFFFGVSTPGIPVQANAVIHYKSGVAAFNGMGSVTGTTDYNSGSLFPNQAFTDTYTISNTGRGTMTTSGSIFYLISPSKYLLIDVTAGAAYSYIIEGER